MEVIFLFSSSQFLCQIGSVAWVFRRFSFHQKSMVKGKGGQPRHLEPLAPLRYPTFRLISEDFQGIKLYNTNCSLGTLWGTFLLYSPLVQADRSLANTAIDWRKHSDSWYEVLKAFYWLPSSISLVRNNFGAWINPKNALQLFRVKQIYLYFVWNLWSNKHKIHYLILMILIANTMMLKFVFAIPTNLQWAIRSRIYTIFTSYSLR